MSDTGQKWVQEDDIGELRRSKKVVGELNPVIWDDRRDEVVSGAHRLKAGWKTVKHIRTRDDVEFYRLKLHYNIQRGMPPAEVVSMLANYGDALIAQGMVPGGKLMAAICEMSPWKKRYTYEMVPRRFKNEDGPGRPEGSPNLQPPQIPKRLPASIVDEDEAPAGPALVQATCPRCTHQFRGVVMAGVLVDPS